MPPFFKFNLRSPSGIATCTAVHAIRRFRRQYCSRGSNSDKYTLLLYLFQADLIWCDDTFKLNNITGIICDYELSTMPFSTAQPFLH
jgi:hypothetical protein